MRTLKITLAFICFTFFSCDNSTTIQSKESDNQVVNKEHDHVSFEEIELDNGNKWKVDDAMLVHIKNMEKDVIAFNKGKQKEYVKLAENLQKNIGLLTSNCTMKGKAHDELHKWLLPYIEMVDKLSKSKNEVDSEKIFNDINDSFIEFNKYFN